MTAKIQLYSKWKPIDRYATVDRDMIETLSQYRWSIFFPNGSRTAYARTSIDAKTVYMHHLVIGTKDGLEVDHCDGDGLNNTRANLRHVTHQQNIQAIHALNAYRTWKEKRTNRQ